MSSDIQVEIGEEKNTAADNRYLIFDIREENYAIEIIHILEIIEILPITRVPSLPPFIVGIINLRGTIIPIMDVRLRFGYETKEYDSRTCIIVLEHDGMHMGVIVDSVQEVVVIGADLIAEPPKKIEETDTMDYYIKGIAQWNESIQLIVDIERFFDINGTGVACV